MLYTEEDILSIEGADHFHELPHAIKERKQLEQLEDQEIPVHLKDFVDNEELSHREFLNTEFWQRIPVWKDISEEEFLNVKFQNKHTIRSIDKLIKAVEGLASEDFIEDVRRGIEQAPMNISISPYIFSLIDWDNPYTDPLRIQFIPIGNGFKPDHPKLTLDSLAEQGDSPVEGLVHRYFDKVLFLPLDVCPVYCRFCTRSYAIGGDTDLVDKQRFRNAPDNWKRPLLI
jgi:lysine 2,3-aminomutase